MHACAHDAITNYNSQSANFYVDLDHPKMKHMFKIFGRKKNQIRCDILVFNMILCLGMICKLSLQTKKLNSSDQLFEQTVK